jgi:hypothetical protein
MGRRRDGAAGLFFAGMHAPIVVAYPRLEIVYLTIRVGSID